MNGQKWIEEVSKANPLSLGCEPKGLAITIKTEGTPSADNFQTRLGITEENDLCRAVVSSIDNIQSVGAYPLDPDDFNSAITC